MPFKNEKALEQAAERAAKGDRNAFVDVINAMLNDGDWEMRCLAAFALIDHIPAWEVPQLIIILESVLVIKTFNQPTGVYRKTLRLLAFIAESALQDRLGGVSAS